LYRQVTAGFAIMLLLLGIVAWVAVVRLGQLHKSASALERDGAVVSHQISQLAIRLPQLRDAIANVGETTDPVERRSRYLDLGVTGTQFANLTLELTRAPGSPAFQAAALEIHRRTANASRQLARPLAGLQNGTLTTRQAMAAIDPVLMSSQPFIRKLANEHVISGRRRSADAAARYRSGLILLSVMTALALLVGIGSALLVARRIGSAVADVVDAADGMAKGDLRVRCAVTERDEVHEIGRSLNSMAERLGGLMAHEDDRRREVHTTIDAIRGFAGRVAAGDLTARVDLSGELAAVAENLNRMAEGLSGISTQMASGSNEITASAVQILAAVSQNNASTAEQAESIAQTSVTIEEVRANAEQSASRADELARQARESAMNSADGDRAVAELVAGMDEIDVRVGVIAEGIRELSVRSEAIGAITASVRDLAEQSNMLALNATIEAAKAGEQGRGFAVVADEVRNLAEQSKQATVQVQQILVEIRDATKAAVSATDDGTRVVSQARERAGETGTLIRRMRSAIEQTAVVASQIAMGAKEQAVGMDQIGDAIVSVSATTKQIARSAHQTEDAASGLTTIADELTQATSRYRLGATVPRPVGGPQ
jgi:methyl-accepting chemotaxis protein